MSILDVANLVSGSWSQRVSFSLEVGEVAVVLGRNGVGKTTLLNTISGLLPAKGGSIKIDGRESVSQSALSRIRLGVTLAPEGRKIFGRLSVLKNLQLGAFNRRGKQLIEIDTEWLLSVFSDLKEKLYEPAATLSGGQQTQLSIARALMSNPKLLLLDEPALGLDPRNVEKLVDALKKVQNERNMTILVAEQSGPFARAFARRVLMMDGGEILFNGGWAEAHDSGLLALVFA